MDQMIRETLLNPESMTPNPINNTWAYRRQIYGVETDENGVETQFTSTVVVVWGIPDFNIVTAFLTPLRPAR